MKLEKIKEERKKNKLSFLVKESNEVFVNTIRRLILEEVPTLAIEDVELKDNSSALFDEMLGLRLGLIPIKTDLGSYELKSNCKCNGAGCARCELKLSLKANKKGYVYAEEIKSTDPKCIPVYPRMPVVKLLSRQKVDVMLTAVLGRGKEHAKWAPGWAFYKHEPIVTVGKVSVPELLAEKCTDGVFIVKNNKVELVEEKVYDSNLLDYYAELDKGITVKYTDTIIFTLESWGQLSPKEILHTSAEILVEKIEELDALL